MVVFKGNWCQTQMCAYEAILRPSTNQHKYIIEVGKRMGSITYRGGKYPQGRWYGVQNPAPRDPEPEMFPADPSQLGQNGDMP